jgi:F-type H+-transporting ATPase subunit gamma
VATLRDLRRRIASVKSTQKITKAMELVATAKMRRAYLAMQASRPYTDAIVRVLADLASHRLETTHPFLEQREVKRVALILVTADRGLAGGINTNAIRAANRFVNAQSQKPKLITIGRKGRDFFRRFRDVELVADSSMLSDRPHMSEILPAVTVGIQEFLAGEVDEVHLLYSRYASALSQVPTVVRLIPPQLPVPGGNPDSRGGEAREHQGAEPLYEFEPSPEMVLEKLLPRYVEALVYQAVLENRASFLAAQSAAMRSATDNAGELITDLTLVANKLRQAQITKELMEIVGGAEALAQAS